MKLCMKMYKKVCIKMKLCIINKNVNGQWNLLPVNDTIINLQQNNKIALGSDIKKTNIWSYKGVDIRDSWTINTLRNIHKF